MKKELFEFRCELLKSIEFYELNPICDSDMLELIAENGIGWLAFGKLFYELKETLQKSYARIDECMNHLPTKTDAKKVIQDSERYLCSNLSVYLK